MEEMRKDAGTPPPAASVADYPAAEAPTGSRRRGGNHKRKASALGSGSTSISTTTSSKRQAREKPPVVPFTPIHNGPLTRARQQPNNNAPTSVGASPSGVKIEGEELPHRGVVGIETIKADEFNGMSKEDWEALESKLESDYEAIRSRDANVHVVPNHAGWFSWTKVHSLEEKTLPSFFNGKSETRTPEIYMEARNWIMKKFHANPNTNIELKDLSEISVSELEARQEVMEFLDYWGLINYHPFPKTDPITMSIDDDDDDDDDRAAKMDSTVESLFRFESEKSFTPVVPRNSLATPAAPSGLFPESSITEELVKSEGPEVEYHCNSCSADCSRKRYHCQKQADFDLCTECFNDGKFGSDMSPSDFILMEPAEAGGASSGKWTDQETLLLLEALELFKENWNEIAEHVATKTKAQCILHFVHMPIEDMFLDSGDEIDSTPKENADTISINDTAAPQDAVEMTEIKDNTDNNWTPCSPLKSSKPEEVTGSNAGTVCQNFVMKALTEAFEAVGSLPSPRACLSFAEADNPVMTLAAFLIGLVKPNVATASARSSLKIISGNSSGDKLALRHCFVLEDPPDERTAAEIVEEESQKDEEQNIEKQESSSKLVVDGVCVSNDEDNESNKCSVMEEERPGASPTLTSIDEQASAKESNETSIHEVLEPAPENGSDNALWPEEQVPSTAKDSNDIRMDIEVPPGFEKEPEDGTPVGETSESAEAPKDMDSLPNSENKDPVQTTTSNSIPEHGVNKGTGAEDSMNKEQGDLKSKIDIEHNKLKNAAVTAVSAAAVKAKLLANQEEEQIHRLAALLIEKQLHKLEIKLAFFNEMENMVMRVREQLERSKQRLFHERAQIIAARLGISGSRPMQPTLPVNRAAMNFAHSVPRPIIGVPSLRPPVSRPIMMSNPAASSFVPTTVAGSSVQPSNQDQLSSVGTK